MVDLLVKAAVNGQRVDFGLTEFPPDNVSYLDWLQSSDLLAKLTEQLIESTEADNVEISEINEL